MYEIAQQAKYRILGIVEVYKIGNRWMYEIRREISKTSTSLHESVAD